MNRGYLRRAVAFWVSALLWLSACQSFEAPAPQQIRTLPPAGLPIVAPAVETHSVLNLNDYQVKNSEESADFRIGDADDPAIWVHPRDPALSLVIGTLKKERPRSASLNCSIMARGRSAGGRCG